MFHIKVCQILKCNLTQKLKFTHFYSVNGLSLCAVLHHSYEWHQAKNVYFTKEDRPVEQGCIVVFQCFFLLRECFKCFKWLAHWTSGLEQIMSGERCVEKFWTVKSCCLLDQCEEQRFIRVTKQEICKKFIITFFYVFLSKLFNSLQRYSLQQSLTVFSHESLLSGHGLQCYECKLGFWDICFTTKKTCDAGQQCFSGLGKAGKFMLFKSCNTHILQDFYEKQCL